MKLPKTSIAIISGTGKATNFKFCSHRIDCNKNPFTISGKVALGILRGSRKFSGHNNYIGLRPGHENGFEKPRLFRF